MAKSGVEKILDKWRGLIKGKQRRIVSFEEIIQQKIESLRPWIHPESEPLEDWEFRQFRYTRKRERIFDDADWRPIRVGETWGGPDQSALFRCQATMPERFAGKPVVLKVYFSGDGLLSVDGLPYHGLDPFRDSVPMTDCAAGTEVYQLEAECYIMWHFGEGEVKTFEESQWATFDPQINEAYWDLRAAFNVMMVEGIEPELLEFLRHALAEATRHIDQEERSYDVVRGMALHAQGIVRRKIYQSQEFRKKGKIHLCGNSHLDLVYLWTHAEFVRKIGRTHATALRMMERYPHYTFCQSQPLMYREMKETYPEIFEQVKQRVREGRWEVIGAFWVEPDCNLPSGESFVRQLLHGIEFIEQEFGITPKTAWVPDVFGNAWTMPQIFVQCGLKYFVTHKMAAWNDTNPWRHSVFWWQGPDGSRIFATVPPTIFIGTMEPDHLKEHWDGFSKKASVGESLFTYGWGDGGGGPDPEMLEYVKRYESFPGMVPTTSSTVERCLESMYEKALGADLPVLDDELYLEEHRGVYTTKGRLKKLNRYCEFLYRKAELFSCFANVPYPQSELDRGWELVLTNQFHDSLPGTHITAAYDDLLEAYDTATEIGHRVLRGALDNIASRVDTRGPGRALLVFNGQPFTRDSLARIEMARQDIHVLDPEGRQIPHQFTEDFATGQTCLVFPVANLPSCGYKTYRLIDGPGIETFPAVRVSTTGLENERLKVAVNSEGEITSLRDTKASREWIDPDGRGNVFCLYQDIPGTFDAWDIEPHYTDLLYDLPGATVRVSEEGAVRSAIEVTRKFRNSTIVQRIVLAAGAKRVDFETCIDWHEQHKLLKVRFHTPIAARQATFDIAYGNIQRPTTRNNSFEQAKFEVPAHLWMDLSQPDYGLSLLNDCKYGHEAHGGMMALTLLKGPKYPDPVSDQEEHHFVYSLYPHDFDWRRAHTHDEALDLNDPVETVVCDSHDGDLPSAHSFLSLTDVEASAFTNGITLEAVKRARHSSELIIRVVERYGIEHEAVLRAARPFVRAAQCNLLEREDSDVPLADGTVPLTIRPYEIKTFKAALATEEEHSR